LSLQNKGASEFHIGVYPFNLHRHLLQVLLCIGDFWIGTVTFTNELDEGNFVPKDGGGGGGDFFI